MIFFYKMILKIKKTFNLIIFWSVLLKAYSLEIKINQNIKIMALID